MSVSRRLRFAVLERDGFTCRYCGHSAPSVLLEVDHVVPRSRGGSNHPANLATSCHDCNQGKKAHRLRDIHADCLLHDWQEVDSLRSRLDDAEQHINELRTVISTLRERG